MTSASMDLVWLGLYGSTAVLMPVASTEYTAWSAVEKSSFALVLLAAVLKVRPLSI